jgi:hypothetical protein
MKKKSAPGQTREQLLYQDIEPFETRESRMPKVRRFAYVL